MKIGPIEMTVILLGIGVILVKETFISKKQNFIKKINKKINSKNNIRNIDF